MGIKFPFATFAKSSSRRAWVVKNANDDSKRNSKELQPKIDDAPGRAERERKRDRERKSEREREREGEEEVGRMPMYRVYGTESDSRV